MREEKTLCSNEEAGIKVVQLESIPAGANPFHHDNFHMGSHLVRGWVAMHQAHDDPANPRPLEYLILINTRTGKGLKIYLPKET